MVFIHMVWRFMRILVTYFMPVSAYLNIVESLETQLLGTRIILNDFLFKKFFNTKFSSVISNMNASCPDTFEVSFEEAKKVISDPKFCLSNIGPLSLYSKNKFWLITLIPRKGSICNVTFLGAIVLYYLIKKYKINWASWFCEYMLESIADVHASASLPYGLLITRILLYYSIDLSLLPHGGSFSHL